MNEGPETDQLLAWIVGAMGGALAVGTTMALLRPRESPTDGDLERIAELEARAARVLASGSALSIRDLAIGGRELQELGMTPGRAMGQVLAQLLEKVLDDPERNTRETLLAEARGVLAARGAG